MSTQPVRTNEELVAECVTLLEGDPGPGEPKDRERRRRFGQLVEQLAERLLPQLERLAARFAPSVRRGAMDRDDLVQEAYVRLYQAILSYNPAWRVPFGGFLQAVVRNRFIDLARKARGENYRALPENLALPCPAADRHALLLELNDSLDSLLADDPQRECKLRLFREYHFGNWTMAQLACQFGVSTSTVCCWLAQVGAAYQAASQGSPASSASGEPEPGRARSA